MYFRVSSVNTVVKSLNFGTFLIDSSNPHDSISYYIPTFFHFEQLKNLEAELAQMQEDLASSERNRRNLQAERDDLLEEISSGSAGK